MKMINKTIASAFGLALSVATFSACSDAEYKPIENAVFINGSAAEPLRVVTVGDDEISTGIVVRSSALATADIKAKVAVMQETLDAYNKRYDANYVMLPADRYTISASELTIEKGKIAAPELMITIKPFTEEMQASGKKYALPITIDAEGAEATLQGARSFIVACDQVIKTKAIELQQNQGLRTTYEQPIQTNTWTVEMRVKSSDIRPEFNNQSFMGIGAMQGGEGAGYIFGRWEGDIFQFKINGHDGISASVKPESNKWYHIALVCDNGTASIYVNGQLSRQEQNAKFAVAGAYQNFVFAYPRTEDHWYRRSNYFLSEVRFWNRALTGNQIRNNRFSIDPQTPGLVGYWKLNEGEGTTFRDATGRGHDLQLYEPNRTEGLVSHWVDIRSDQD